MNTGTPQQSGRSGDRMVFRSPLTLESAAWLVGGAVAALSALAAGGSWLDRHVDSRVEAYLRADLVWAESRLDALDGRLDRQRARLVALRERLREQEKHTRARYPGLRLSTSDGTRSFAPLILPPYWQQELERHYGWQSPADDTSDGIQAP